MVFRYLHYSYFSHNFFLNNVISSIYVKIGNINKKEKDFYINIIRVVEWSITQF